MDSAAPRRRRWADDTPPCDRTKEDAEGESQYGDEDAEWEDEEEEDNAWQHQPSAEDLRSRWVVERRAVKALERAEWDDGSGPTAALSAARLARDRAEQTWRAAIAPKPVSIRMGTAQRKVDRAQRAVDKATMALKQFEEEAEHRREVLQKALEAAEKRWRDRQMNST